MSIFNYTIYYKDAKTMQDLASPVMVGYDTFNTPVVEAQKSFDGYTARAVTGHDKTTPLEEEYNNKLPSTYRLKLAEYKLAKTVSDRNIRYINSIKDDPDYYGINGVGILEKYKTYARGSYSYFDNIKVFTSIQGVEALARPLSWGSDGTVGFNYSGKAGSNGDLSDVSSILLHNVSRTVSGRNVNLRITVLSYIRDTYISGAIPGIWVAPYGLNNDGIGIWLYDAYKATLRFNFEDAYGNPLIIPITSAVSDIDYYQQIKVNFSHSGKIVTRPPGSNLSVTSGYLGDAQGMVIEPNGESNIPRGSFFMAGIGSSATIDILGNLPGKPYIFNPGKEGNHASFEIGFFGNASRGEFLDFSVPPKPDLPTFSRTVTILYDKIARTRPWAIRNSGSWKSFVTKNIHMARRRDGEFMQASTEVNEEDVGKPFTRLNNTGRYLMSFSLSGQGIRKNGVWKQQGKIGS